MRGDSQLERLTLIPDSKADRYSRRGDVGPSTYLIQYRNGASVREGAGLAFFYFAPSASLVSIPVATGLGANDVFAINKNGTGSGTAELHILAASANYRSFAIQTKAALHEIDQTWSLCAVGNRDMVAIRRSGGDSKSTELHVIAA